MYRFLPKRYVTAPFRPANYRALGGIVRDVERPLDFLWRYVTERGDYPGVVRLRTPLGPVELTVYSTADVTTVNEVFCRLDYRCDPAIRTVVDIGSNIGISAAYFLTRNPGVRVWCYEPAPLNIPRLRHNLAPFEGLWELDETAVGPEEGESEIEFGIEPTGRHGNVWLRDGWERVRVPYKSINRVLRDVLAETGQIDVLKIDTEGLEAAMLAAIDPELGRRIDLIVFENDTGEVKRLRPPSPVPSR
jgi:FkbM family methyltransferase